ncbi:MAG: LCP family protein [Clostridia bacterium]|nr:LCP family protein [Clostridia bacterium]
MKKSFMKKYFQSLAATLGVLMVVFLLLMGIDFTGGAARLRAESENGIISPGSGGVINVLVMCTDADGLRTDAIMLASYDTEKNTINMLSLPRDLRMYVGNRYQKINAAHAFSVDGKIGGALGTCEAVSRLTGVPINYYIDFSFSTMEKVMDNIGPVTFTIPDLYGDGVGMVYDDPTQDLHINLPPGTYELNGEQVVHLLRYRKGNEDPVTGIRKGYINGDEDRIKVQQDFVKALVEQKLNLALINKLPSIFSDVMSEVDTNLTVGDVIKYSKYLVNFTSAGIRSETVPGDNLNESSNGAVMVPNMPALSALVTEMFENADTAKMSYTKGDGATSLYPDGYTTVGGYVRTKDRATLNNIKSSNLTNDELCLLNNITQVYTPPAPTETPAPVTE